CASPIDAESAGPHAGQAFGCAWKRRSAGLSYSERQRSHITKSAMVVCGRSYGISRMMVYRGPQLVQLVKAYPYRRLCASAMSVRQASQVAMSGETNANLPVSATLGRMRNSRSPAGGTEVTARS